jgi:hypothetical protein
MQGVNMKQKDRFRWGFNLVGGTEGNVCQAKSYEEFLEWVESRYVTMFAKWLDVGPGKPFGSEEQLSEGKLFIDNLRMVFQHLRAMTASQPLPLDKAQNIEFLLSDIQFLVALAADCARHEIHELALDEFRTHKRKIISATKQARRTELEDERTLFKRVLSKVQNKKNLAKDVQSFMAGAGKERGKDFEEIAARLRASQEGTEWPGSNAPRSFTYDAWEEWINKNWGHLSERELAKKIGRSQTFARKIKKKGDTNKRKVIQ